MKRLEAVRANLRDNNIEVLFITKMADITWLTGFSGTSAYIAVGEKTARFITDGRYETAARAALAPEWELEIVTRYGEAFSAFGKEHRNITLQPEANVGLYETFREAGVDVAVDKADLMQQLRMLKSPEEIQLLREEYLLAGNAFKAMLADVRYGETERTWAAKLEYRMKLLGADGPSFDTITASGPRGALPHGVASGRVITEQDAVTLDFGSARAYKSDYTRVIYNGKDPEILHVIDTVREALQLAVAAVKPGVPCSELDRLAREHIAKAGFGAYFNHSLGHGVGMEVHERPALNASSRDIVRSGMVFTVEPGIYLPGKFGIRLEDTVSVGESGCELLSSVLDKYVYILIGE